MAIQTITGGNGTTGQTGEEIKDIINNNFSYIPDVTDTVWVDENGDDDTGEVGREGKPFATIAAALAAGSAVTYLRVKLGIGTFSAPDVTELRSNLWLEGSGKPGYDNSYTTTGFAAITITDPTALVGGTIIQGQVYFRDRSNVTVSDLGVDCGSAYVTGGGTESNQLVFISATTVAPWTLMKNIQIRNVTTLGRTAGSSFHGIQIENAYKPIVQNCDTYFSTHGIVLKTYGGIINNVRCNFHTANGIIIKHDSYAFSFMTQLSNFEIQGGGGLRIEIGSGTSAGVPVLVSNGIMRSPTFGVLFTSGTTANNNYSQLYNIKIYGSSGIGFDLADTQSVQVSHCVALACTTGFRVVSTTGDNYCHIINCHAEACTTGFNLNGASGAANVFARNLSARSNTTGYVFSGNVYGSGLDGDTNSTLQTGSIINRDLGTVNTVSPTSPNRTITMIINGTTYYIHAKTTND